MWSIIGAILPWTSLATLALMVWYQRRAASYLIRARTAESKLLGLEVDNEMTIRENKRLKIQINAITRNFDEANVRRITAERKADAYIAHANELAQIIHDSPDVLQSAKDLAKHFEATP